MCENGDCDCLMFENDDSIRQISESNTDVKRFSTGDEQQAAG